MKSPVDKKLIRHVGRQIMTARKRLGYTQAQLAEKVDLSTNYLADVEAGRYGVTLTNLRNISRALHVSTDFLIYGEPPESDISFLLEQLKQATPELRDILVETIQLQIKAWSKFELPELLRRS